MAKLIIKGFTADQVISATPSTSLKGSIFSAKDVLTFVRATSEVRGEGDKEYDVIEAEYLSSSLGLIRVPLSELIRMKDKNGKSIIEAKGDSMVNPPATITIIKSEGRLKKGITKNAKQKRDDYQYPTNCYSLAEDMYDQDSETKFNYNALIASPLIEGNITPLQDYTVS